MYSSCAPAIDVTSAMDDDVNESIRTRKWFVWQTPKKELRALFNVSCHANELFHTVPSICSVIHRIPFVFWPTQSTPHQIFEDKTFKAAFPPLLANVFYLKSCMTLIETSVSMAMQFLQPKGDTMCAGGAASVKF